LARFRSHGRIPAVAPRRADAGKFRNSWEKTGTLPPGKMVELNFSMPDVDHTFRRGHRIMVQIQSSWFLLWIAIRRVSWNSGRETGGLQEGDGAGFSSEGRGVRRSGVSSAGMRMDVPLHAR